MPTTMLEKWKLTWRQTMRLSSNSSGLVVELNP
jgi:hypothetical protein